MNIFRSPSVKDALHTIFTECGVYSTTTTPLSEAELQRDYVIEIEDQDFGTKVAFPRSVSSII